MAELPKKYLGSFEPSLGKIGVMHFTCVICEQDKTYAFWQPGAKDRPLPPICSYCERVHRSSPIHNGAFFDRRLAKRLFVIAEALHDAARRIDWRAANAAA